MTTSTTTKRTTADVYVWWDEYKHDYRYDLTPLASYDRIDHILLPEGFFLYQTELGETLACRTLGHAEDELQDAWRIHHNGTCYVLVDAYHNVRTAFSCKTIEDETEDTTTKRYYDITEVMDRVRDTLGVDYEDAYDIEGIARELIDFDEDGHLVADLEREDYWHIVAQYQL